MCLFTRFVLTPVRFRTSIDTNSADAQQGDRGRDKRRVLVLQLFFFLLGKVWENRNTEKSEGDTTQQPLVIL